LLECSRSKSNKPLTLAFITRNTRLWIALSIVLSRFPGSLGVFYTVFSDQLII
jgi:hypothetical protein